MSNEMPRTPIERNFSPERERSLLARVTLARHEETHYTGEGRDITEAGEERARERGARLAEQKGAPVLVGHSPQPRAKGTAEALLEGMDSGDFVLREARILNQTEFRDPAIIEELIAKYGRSQEKWAEAHYADEFFYNNEARVETGQERLERLHRGVAVLLQHIVRGKINANANKDEQAEAPHLLFVSHFEMISLLLDEIFDVEQTYGTFNVPTFGEHVDVDVFAPTEEGDVPLTVSFRGVEKRVVFDMSLRRFRLP